MSVGQPLQKAFRMNAEDESVNKEGPSSVLPNDDTENKVSPKEISKNESEKEGPDSALENKDISMMNDEDESKKMEGPTSVLPNNDDTESKGALKDISEYVKVESLGSTDDKASADTKVEALEDRSTWDFSNRKVLIQGVHKFDDTKKTKKTLSKWISDIEQNQDGLKIEYTKVKKPPKDTWMLVTLNEEAMVQPFIDYINNHNGGITNKRGNKLFAKRPEPTVARDEDRKRKYDEDPKEGDTTKRQRMTPEAIEAARRPVSDDEIRDKTTPLWKLSQEDQISSKMKELVFKCAQKIVKEIKARFRCV